MSADSKPKEIADDVVVSLCYTLTVDGEVFDFTEDDEAIEFLQGYGNIIPGLEAELYGMQIGDKKQVTVPTEEAYGEYDQEEIRDVPRSEFPPDVPLAPGVELELTDTDDDLLYAKVVSIAKDTVKLDFNHPLAGKELHFYIEVVDLRPPTAEELEHGHVHDEDEDAEEE
jgi:FKBP-type peptidyl-prolyl cis-trans isomerase SlyD